ncbi:hypothetical protein [Cellvibrio sp. QJXJ]|uniref:hypothetical protein n=1 Tax=Cellvibrio sp. QJXJ TaxID=2964606 RepID=UPI0021C390DA|nr:hypothetical protein [Cellvibrio sp. QJXJ]UUA73557.1 hypothetical protein NNX04_03700 [Cellvibrio sp. QJXJ]
MSSSSSSPKTTTTTSDLRTTNTLNAGLGGDISEALVAAGNYGDTSLYSLSDNADRSINDYSDRSFTDNADNSFRMDLADNSDRRVTDNSDHSRRYDSSVRDYSDRSFEDNSDNSMKVEMDDNSDRSVTDNSDRSHYQTSEFSDYSDNSMTVEMRDESDRSVYSYSDSSTTNVTDGGAFEVVKNAIDKMSGGQTEALGAVTQSSGDALDLVRDIGGKVIDMLGENQLEVLRATNSLVERSVTSSANLANQSLSQAMQIKAGQAVTEPANQNLRELAKVALIGGAIYAGTKMLGK